jgi:hypothetical protein
MRQNSPPFSALGRQLAEWRRPLDEAPDVEDAVTRMVRALERPQTREQRGREGDADFSRAAAD